MGGIRTIQIYKPESLDVTTRPSHHNIYMKAKNKIIMWIYVTYPLRLIVGDILNTSMGQEE